MTFVYFIQAGADGPVKIGTSRDPERRLAELGFRADAGWRILRFIEGSHRLEAWFHEHFSSLRIQGEWFRYSKEMEDCDHPSHGELCDEIAECRGKEMEEARRIVVQIINSQSPDLSLRQKLVATSRALRLNERRVRAIYHRENRTLGAEELASLHEAYLHFLDDRLAHLREAIHVTESEKYMTRTISRMPRGKRD